MNGKYIGISMMALMLCFTVFLAMGDNPTMAAQQGNASQNASVSVADVIGISVPSLVNASNTGIGSQTALELKYGANTNNVTSTSNGKIDVYIKSVAQIMNNNTTAYPTDNLAFYFTNDTGAHNQFNGAWQKAIDQWKIPTGTPISGANKLVKLDVDVPTFVAEGWYNTTVNYAAVRSGQGPV